MSNREAVLKNCFKIKQGLCLIGDAALGGNTFNSGNFTLSGDFLHHKPDGLLKSPNMETLNLSASRIHSSWVELVSVPFEPDYLYTHPISVVDRWVFENAVFFDNDMYVSGESTFNNTIDALSGVTLHDWLNVSGTLTVANTATFVEDVIVESDLYVHGSQITTGNSTISGGLTIQGPVSAVSDLYVDGNVWFKSNTTNTLFIGSDDLDNVVFVSDVSSNILPDESTSYNLGSNDKRWYNLYTDDINATGRIETVGWNPLSAGAVSWIDASDINTIGYNSGTSSVSSITDKIDRSRRLERVTLGEQPLSGAISNRHALTFDGVDDNMEFTVNPLGETTSSIDFATIFVVYRIEDTSATGTIFNNTGGANATVFKANAHQDCSLSVGGTTGHSLLSSGSWAQDGEVMIAMFTTARGGQANLKQIWKNGDMESGVDNSVEIHPGEKFFIGGVQGADSDQSVTIGEVVIITNELTSEVREKMEGYLAHKWNLESTLPAEHPYKDRFVLDGDIKANAIDIDGNISTTGDLTTQGSITYDDPVSNDPQVWSKQDVKSAKHIQTTVESLSTAWLEQTPVSNQIHVLTRGAIGLITPAGKPEFLAIASANNAGDSVWNQVSYEHAMVVPYDTTIKRIVLRASGSQGATVNIAVHTNQGVGNKNSNGYKYFNRIPMETVQNTFTENNTSDIFTFASTTSASAGYTIGVSVSADQPINSTNVSIVLQYESP